MNRYYIPNSVIRMKVKDDFELLKNLHSPKEHLILKGDCLKLLKSLNSSVIKNKEDKKVISQLKKHHIILKEGETIQVEFHRPKHLEVWLHVINNCNLKCKYCYVKKDERSMSEKLGFRIIKKLFETARKNNYKKIKIKFSGGEPLLEFEKVIKFNKYAKKLAKENSIIYESVVLSNGILLDKKKLELLKKNKINLMVSIDGLKKDHDSQRIFPNGKGTFEIITQKLQLCLDNNIVPDISITVTKKSVKNLFELVASLLDKNIYSFSLNFFRETECVQADTQGLDFSKNDKTFINGLMKTFKVIEDKLPNEVFLNNLSDRALLGVFRERTCGVGNSYLVINHKGEISKCQMKMNEVITTINDSNFLDKIQTSKKSVQNPTVDKKPTCRKCIWKYYCCGGCPVMARHFYGKYSYGSPFCNIYKKILPQIWRLEGLRMLKYEK